MRFDNDDRHSERPRWQGRQVRQSRCVRSFLNGTICPDREWLDADMTPSRFQKQIRFLRNRLSPQGYAGLHLTVGVLVVLICGWCFGEIAEDVSHGDPIVQVDRHVAVWFHQHASPTITQVVHA